MLVAALCLSSGRVLLLRLGFDFANQSEEAALSAGVGFGVITYSMVMLGGARLYQPAVAWLLLAALAFLSIWGLRRAPMRVDPRKLFDKLKKLPWSLRGCLALLLCYSLGYLIVALALTLEGDSLAGYLLTAREYAHQGGIVSVDYAYTDSYPANGQMLSTLGFLLQGQILAQLLVVWMMGLLALLAIYSLGRTWISRRAALVAMASWYGTGSVGYLAASGKIDLAWAFFDLLAVLAFSRWYFEKDKGCDWRWLALSGFFLGLAGGAKQASGFTALVMAIAVAVRLRQSGTHKLWDWGRCYAALGLPTALALLWMARSYVMTGALAFAGEGLRGDAGILGFFRTVWSMSLLGNAPSLEGPLGKPIGPVILTAVPMLVMFHNVERRVWHMLAFCGLMLVLWFNGVQRARHMLPTLAVLSLLAGHVVILALAQRPSLGKLLVATTLTSLVLNLGAWGYVNLVALQRLPYVLGLQDEDSYLEANLPKSRWIPNHAIVTYAREHLPAEAHIASLPVGGHSYYMERPVYAVWNQTPEDVPSLSHFASQLRKAGITHVFLNDYVINAHKMHEAWLAQSEFQTYYLYELTCSEGQCLYAFEQ